MYDFDEVTEHDLIGSYECYMNALLTAKNTKLKDELKLAKSSTSRGRIILQADSVENSNH